MQTFQKKISKAPFLPQSTLLIHDIKIMPHTWLVTHFLKSNMLFLCIFLK